MGRSSNAVVGESVPPLVAYMMNRLLVAVVRSRNSNRSSLSGAFVAVTMCSPYAPLSSHVSSRYDSSSLTRCTRSVQVIDRRACLANRSRIHTGIPSVLPMIINPFCIVVCVYAPPMRPRSGGIVGMGTHCMAGFMP